MKSKDKIFTAIMAGIATLFGVVMILAPAKSAVVNDYSKRSRFSENDVWAEQHYENGCWVWHLYYETSEYEYEVSDASYEEALYSLRKLVLG